MLAIPSASASTLTIWRERLSAKFFSVVQRCSLLVCFLCHTPLYLACTAFRYYAWLPAGYRFSESHPFHDLIRCGSVVRFLDGVQITHISMQLSTCTPSHPLYLFLTNCFFFVSAIFCATRMSGFLFWSCSLDAQSGCFGFSTYGVSASKAFTGLS
jgi:hypothetical protein